MPARTPRLTSPAEQQVQVILFCTTAGIHLAGATGLEPATFGVTGRTKFNEINAGCNIFFA